MSITIPPTTLAGQTAAAKAIAEWFADVIEQMQVDMGFPRQPETKARLAEQATPKVLEVIQKFAPTLLATKDSQILDFMDDHRPWVHQQCGGISGLLYWGMVIQGHETVFGKTFREVAEKAMADVATGIKAKP